MVGMLDRLQGCSLEYGRVVDAHGGPGRWTAARAVLDSEKEYDESLVICLRFILGTCPRFVLGAGDVYQGRTWEGNPETPPFQGTKRGMATTNHSRQTPRDDALTDRLGHPLAGTMANRGVERGGQNPCWE